MVMVFYIQPGAKMNRWLGPYAEGYKVKVAAPAVDGKANAELIAFLAVSLGVKRKQLVIIGGTQSRQKRIRIETNNEAEEAALTARIDQLNNLLRMS